MTNIKQELWSLEQLLDHAYGLDGDGIKSAVKGLNDNPLNGEFPYLIDAVRTHLLWLKGIASASESDPAPGVYVIAYEPGTVKIGKTTNFKQRLRSLSTATPHRPSNTHFQPTSAHTDVESKLHQYFKECRMNGEFFRIDFDLAVEALQQLCYIPSRQPPQEADRG